MIELLVEVWLIGGNAMGGRALTKTRLHSPFVIFEPSAISLCPIWSFENKSSRPYRT